MAALRPIFFDLETTGTRCEVDRIVEIAAFDPYQNATFQSLVHPGLAIPAEASAIHGITNEMVHDAPSLAKAGASFISFCSGNVLLIAHNGELFDIPFLRAEFRRHKLSFQPGWAFVDSLKWSRKFRKDLPRHSLQYLREICNIPPNTAHRALDDVMVLFQVFSLMVDDLSPEEILHIGGGIPSLAADNEKDQIAVEGQQCEFQLFVT